MIPVNPLGMLLGLLLLLLSLACFSGLFALLVACLLPRARRFMRLRIKRFCLLALVMLVGSLPMIEFLSWEVDEWREQRALNPRLERDETLGDLRLPAGTRVWMERLEPQDDLSGAPLPHGLRSLKRVEFDGAPVELLGMSVHGLELDVGRGTARVKLAKPATVEGWPCSTGEVVTFDYPFGELFEFEGWRLESCLLEAGSEVAGMVWPKTVMLWVVKKGIWRIDGGEAVMRFKALDMTALNLWLDGQGDVHAWEGVLAETKTLGTMRYPAGTRVRDYQGNLLFSPVADGDAVETQGGGRVELGRSVLQTVAGEVLGIHDNDEVGVIDWYTLLEH